jgi:protoheme IX farnesyltransferase
MSVRVEQDVAVDLPPLFARAADYMTLVKPRLTMLVLATVLVGYFLGAGSDPSGQVLLAVLWGATLVGGGASAINQYLERDADAKMRRTADRPLPSGRMDPVEALGFGVVLCGAGVTYLAFYVNALTGFLAVLTLITYLSLYTPLKSRSPCCTMVGAIPGALPPMMGWTAATGELGAGAWALFGILFLWQLPHFYAIAWIYRDDYARAGYPMFPVIPGGESRTARQIIALCALLIPVSILPAVLGLAGWGYVVAAVVLGLIYLAFGVRLAIQRTLPAARHLFLVSIAYMPLLLAILLFS